MKFIDDMIHDVEVRELEKHTDSRGWLTEIFRSDELPCSFSPAMCYVSMTRPGVKRGPHEHQDQTDYFVFTGPGRFQITLWDNRETSQTYGVRQTILAGDTSPMMVLVPPGVVHGYKNVSEVPGLVVNCPDRLFAGHRREFPVDEIRHENVKNSPFQMD
jgi:dTDP-4-dehydrorhamnose 3,5-epimerase